MSRLALAFVLVALTGTSVFAQTPLRATHFDVARPARQFPAQEPTADYRMILGGLVGGAVGFFLGGIAGAMINDTDDTEDDLAALAGFALGATIGETIALPLGVHIANHGQGNYVLSLLASAGITGVGVAIATSGEDRLEYLIPVPLLQLWSSIVIEKKTTK
jgi:hypothetical protein